MQIALTKTCLVTQGCRFSCVYVCVCLCTIMHAQKALVSTSEQQVGLLSLSYKRLSETTSADHLGI